MNSFQPNTRLNHVLAAISLATISLPVSAATLVVNPDGGTFTTIQAAVDAANPGDTISIKTHPDPTGYQENVVINTPDLTLKGSGSASGGTSSQRCPKVILDGCETPEAPTSCGATVLQINEPDTRILSLTIRHGEVDIDTADRTTIEKACFIDPEIDMVATEGGESHDIVIKKSFFQGGRSESIDLSGDNIQILNNRIYMPDDGVEISGDNFVVKGNRIVACNDACIDVDGDNGRVEKNTLDGGDDGIDYDGDQPFISGNKIEGMADDSINLNCINCTGGTISKNKVIGSTDDDEGISVVNGNNLLIEKNTLIHIAEHGIEYNGDNGFIRNNKVARTGTESTSESCIDIDGNGNTIEKNTLRFCSFAAIRHNTGDNNIFTGNKITGPGQAGILVRNGEGNQLIKNTITSSGGEGIANTGGVNTDIENNKVKKSRTDICNNLTIDSFTGNNFDTGGDSTACVAGLN